MRKQVEGVRYRQSCSSIVALVLTKLLLEHRRKEKIAIDNFAKVISCANESILAVSGQKYVMT